MAAFTTSVGKARPDQKYELCGDSSDNGCDIKECLNTDKDDDERQGDYLLIPGGINSKEENKGEQVVSSLPPYHTKFRSSAVETTTVGQG